MANEEQRRIWNEVNAARWRQIREPIERSLAPFGEAAIAALAPRPGQSALDVGCGFGSTTRALAQRVAPGGNVLGIDVSEPFITIARSEAPPNVRYLCADAQTHSFEMRFDLCLSRFGAMFFDDPAAAFANLRRALKPGGAFAAVTWGPLQQNAWVDVPLRIVRNYLPGPTTPAAGPGPFSLSDRAALERLLTGAGFAQARVVPLPLPYAGGATVEDAVAFLLQVGPPSAILREAGEAARPLLPRIEADLREALGPFSRPHGVELPAVALLATAAATG